MVPNTILGATEYVDEFVAFKFWQRKVSPSA